MHTEEILAQLVAFPTVVGRPNGEIADWIRGYAERVGATVSFVPRTGRGSDKPVSNDRACRRTRHSVVWTHGCGSRE